jgi:uncharacterized protein (DUF4415 family)
MSSMRAKVGDKVRLKRPPFMNERGTVVRAEKRTLVVRVNGHDVEAAVEDVTNLSLAARKAWETMPDRRVGRPKGTRLCDRVSVTLRIDRDLWQAFRQLEQDALVTDRTATINDCLRAKVNELQTKVSSD